MLDASSRLLVNVSNASLAVTGTFYQATQPVSGTVTANAGTNLNTSALALETGGNLATTATNTTTIAGAVSGGKVLVTETSAAASKTDLDSIVTNTGNIPSQGQALAAASTPVVLPAAQITTLTPPTNTGYALDASLSTIDTDLKSNITLHAGTNVVGKVGIDQTTVGTTNAVSIAQIGATTVNTAASGTILVGTADGAGNKLTSNSTTTSSKFGLDGNILSILGTAPTTVGFLDVSLTPKTSGGLGAPATGSIGNTATAVKASAGQVYSMYVGNNNTTVCYVQFFNTATGSVTVGTTAPIASLMIPVGGAFVDGIPNGWAFGTAITIAITTTRSGGTSPSNTVDYNIWYN